MVIIVVVNDYHMTANCYTLPRTLPACVQLLTKLIKPVMLALCLMQRCTYEKIVQSYQQKIYIYIHVYIYFNKRVFYVISNNNRYLSVLFPHLPTLWG